MCIGGYVVQENWYVVYILCTKVYRHLIYIWDEFGILAVYIIN